MPLAEKLVDVVINWLSGSGFEHGPILTAYHDWSIAEEHVLIIPRLDVASGLKEEDPAPFMLHLVLVQKDDIGRLGRVTTELG